MKTLPLTESVPSVPAGTFGVQARLPVAVWQFHALGPRKETRSWGAPPLMLVSGVVLPAESKRNVEPVLPVVHGLAGAGERLRCRPSPH